MALDLGTLQIQIQANTGDAINRLDNVRASAEDVEKYSDIKLNVGVNETEAVRQINELTDAINDITVEDIEISASADASEVNALHDELASLSNVSITATATVSGKDKVDELNTSLDTLENNGTTVEGNATSTGKTDVDNLNTSLDTLEDNGTTVEGNATSEGKDDVDNLNSSLDTLENNGTTVEGNATSEGEDDIETLNEALDTLDGNDADATATAIGEDEGVSELNDALDTFDGNDADATGTATGEDNGFTDLNTAFTSFDGSSVTGTANINTEGASTSLSDLASSVVSIFSEGGNGDNNIPGLLKSFTSLCSGSLTDAVSSIGSNILGILGPEGTVIAALTAAYEAAAKWVEDIEKKAAEARQTAIKVSGDADNIITDSTTSGLTTRLTSVYTALEGINDVKFSDVESAINKLGKTTIPEALTNPSSEAATAFNTLGVTLTHPDGSEKTASEIFEETASAFRNFDGTQAEKDALGYEIFGTKYSALKPILEQSEQTIQNNQKYLYELGAVLSDEQLDILGRLNDLTEWEKLSEQGVQNTVAVQQAEDTGKITQARTEFNRLLNEALKGNTVSIEDWNDATRLYAEGFVGSADTGYAQNNTQAYLQAKWDAETKGLISQGYFDKFESGEGSIYDLIAGAVYWVQDWGADIKLMFMDLLDWLGLVDYQVNFGNTPEDIHEGAATGEGTEAQEELEQVVLDSGETIEEAIDNGTIDVYDANEAASYSMIDEALKLFGIDPSSLNDSQRIQLEGADRAYDNALRDGEDVSEAFDVLLTSLYNIITGKSGNGKDWANLDSSDENVLHYDTATFEEFTADMYGSNWVQAYTAKLNELIAAGVSGDELVTQTDAIVSAITAAGDKVAENEQPTTVNYYTTETGTPVENPNQ